MAQLAIKGHATRGEEVIEMLAMVGGSNPFEHSGDNPSEVYYIANKYKNFIICADAKNVRDCIIFTLEEFLEKYPYKVGDKVYNIIHNENQTITGLVWDVQENEVGYQTNNNEYVYVNYLQPHKKAPMYLNKKANKQSEEIKKTIEPVKEIMEETNTIYHTTEVNFNHPCFDGCNEIELIIPDGWEIKQRDYKMFGVRKQPQYPKTYKECCDVLCIKTMDNDAQGYKAYLIISFQELIIARDAYWKIAGEQMGLGKPWEPDWDKLSTNHEFIQINKGCFTFSSRVLVFPTAEMRDTFYKNFKNLIEGCKEFL